MTTHALRNAVLIAFLATAVACSRQPDPPPAPSTDAQPATALGGVVKKATDEARKKLATENLDIGSHKDGQASRAQITPQGDLLIDGQAVKIDDKQRALLLAHRGHIIAIAEAGIAIGVQGADLGMKAASEAVKGLFSGKSEDFEQRMEAEGKRMEAEAMKLCDRMPALLASQQALAASIPEFKPYATMDQSDVDDCRSEKGGNFNAGQQVGKALAEADKAAQEARTDSGDAAAKADEAARK